MGMQLNLTFSAILRPTHCNHMHFSDIASQGSAVAAEMLEDGREPSLHHIDSPSWVTSAHYHISIQNLTKLCESRVYGWLEAVDLI